MSFNQNTGNYYEDTVNAIANTLLNNKHQLGGVKEIYNYKPEYVNVYPSIGVSWISSNRNRETLGTKAWFSINATCQIVLFYSELERLQRDSDIRNIVYLIEKVLSEHSTLDGFINQEIVVMSSEAVDIISKNGLVAGALITVAVPLRRLINTQS